QLLGIGYGRDIRRFGDRCVRIDRGVARNLRARLVRFRHRVSAMCASMWQGAQACPSVSDSNWGPPRRFQELSFDHPAGKMLPRDVGQGTNPVVALVEAG